MAVQFWPIRAIRSSPLSCALIVTKVSNPKPDHELTGFHSYPEIFEVDANFCTVWTPQVQQKSPVHSDS